MRFVFIKFPILANFKHLLYKTGKKIFKNFFHHDTLTILGYFNITDNTKVSKISWLVRECPFEVNLTPKIVNSFLNKALGIGKPGQMFPYHICSFLHEKHLKSINDDVTLSTNIKCCAAEKWEKLEVVVLK